MNAALRIPLLAVGLMALTATACRAPAPGTVPQQERARQVTTTSDLTDPSTEAVPVLESESPPTTTSVVASETVPEMDSKAINLDGVLAQLDQMLSDLDSTIEGVSQP